MRRRGLAFRVRLLVLFGIFLGVAGWAAHDMHTRRERTAWNRSLRINLAILRLGPVKPDAIAALRARVPALEEQLQLEYSRYRTDGLKPFQITAYGPMDVAEGPPELADSTVLSLVRYAYDRWRYLRKVNEAMGVMDSSPDSVVYMVVRPPENAAFRFVEGASEDGGRIGLVEVELDRGMEDFALFVTAHELFHTLGAKDKYDEFGRTLVPTGLAEPFRLPMFPQEFAELMARNLVVAPDMERPPESLKELRVGPQTAEEVRWR